MPDKKPLQRWEGQTPPYSFEVVAICQEDATGNFDGTRNPNKTIDLVARISTRLPRKKVAVALSLGDNPKLETVTELTARLKKDRSFVLLLEQDQSSRARRRKPWHFGHVLVDNVKLEIDTMTDAD